MMGLSFLRLLSSCLLFTFFHLLKPVKTLVVLHKILASTLLKFSQILVCKEVTSLTFWLKSSQLPFSHFPIKCFYNVGQICKCFVSFVYVALVNFYSSLLLSSPCVYANE